LNKVYVFLISGNYIEEGITMNKKWECTVCGYMYDPAKGDELSIPPGVLFEDLPNDWTCPTCGAGKDLFESI
jgi:rubredoxin